MIGKPYIYSFGRCLAPPEWNFIKMQVCNRLYVIYGGSGWYYENGREHPFLPGHLYLFPHRAAFRVRQLNTDPLDHMYFDFSVTPTIGSDHITVVDLTASDGRAKAFAGVVQSLEWLLQKPLGQKTAEAVSATLSALLQQISVAGATQLLRDKRIERALERMYHMEPDGSLRLPSTQELADMLHLDVNYFIRLFKREVGLTPYQFMRSHRLNVAASYIASGTSVTEAARLVGYESTAALSHALHRRTRQAGRAE